MSKSFDIIVYQTVKMAKVPIFGYEDMTEEEAKQRAIEAVEAGLKVMESTDKKYIAVVKGKD